MPIQFRCQYCRQRLGIADSRAGSLVDCPACGRSLRVPAAGGGLSAAAEAVRAPDAGLQSALEQLVAFGEVGSVESSGAPKGDVLRSRPSARPTLSPAAVARSASVSDPLSELAALPSADPPLLEQPEVLEAISETTEGAAGDDLGESGGVCGDELSTESGAEAGGVVSEVSLSAALGELAVQGVPSGVVADRVSSWRRFFPVLIPVITGLLAFSAGVLTGRGRSGSESAGEALSSALVEGSAAVGGEEVSGAADSGLVEAAAVSGQVSGRVLAVGTTGVSEPDAGALVIFAPLKNSTELRLDGRFLRDSEDDPGRRALVAALSQLGVGVTQAGPDGSYSVAISGAGPHVLIAVSRRISRPGSVALSADVAGALSEWFSSPSPITGRLQAVVRGVTIESPGAGVNQDISIAAPAP